MIDECDLNEFATSVTPFASLLLVQEFEGNEFHVSRDDHFFFLRVPTLAKYRNICNIMTGKHVLEIKVFDLRKRKRTLEVDWQAVCGWEQAPVQTNQGKVNAIRGES